ARLPLHLGIWRMDARVRAGGKHPDDVRVTLVAGPVADVGGSLDLRRGDHGAFEAGAGDETNAEANRHPACAPPTKCRHRHEKRSVRAFIHGRAVPELNRSDTAGRWQRSGDRIKRISKSLRAIT